MAIYANVVDVELRWNQAIPDASVEHVETLLDDAEVLVLDLVPDLAARITSGRLTSGLVKYVVTAMALRVLFNPKGLSSESAGDYSYQTNGTTGDRRMFITADERRLLLGGRGRASTVALSDGALEYVHRPPYAEWRDLTATTLPLDV